MKIKTSDKIWVVTDGRTCSTLTDMVSETTLAGLLQQARGGLSGVERPSIYTSDLEAHEDAMRRMGEMLGHVAAERDIEAGVISALDCPMLSEADRREVARRGGDVDAAEDAYIGRWTAEIPLD